MYNIEHLYTRYPIVARRAWPAGFVEHLGRVRRASKGILHATLNIQSSSKQLKYFSGW